MSIRFLHCSDLHLGFSQFGLDERFKDFGRAFEYIADDALRNKVEYLIIAGDFFNKRSINSKTLSQAVQTFQKLQQGGTRVLAIEGNHDKAPYGEGDSWMRFLHEQGFIHLLQPEFAEGRLVLGESSIVQYPGIRFVGLGYLGSMTEKRLEELREQLKPSSAFTVLIVHAAVDRLLHFGGVPRGAFDGLEEVVDYVALGHIHERYELEDWIYNPGAPESWDLGEGGKEKGHYQVTVSSTGKTVAYVPSRPRPIYNVIVDLDDTVSYEEIPRRVLDYVRKSWDQQQEPGMVRVTLTGQVNFNPLSIMEGEIVQELGRALPLVHGEIVNQVRPKGQGNEDLSGQLSREQIEKVVLESLLETRFGTQFPQGDHFYGEAVEIAQELRNLSFSGDQDIMFELVTAWAKRLKAQEVAHEDLPATASEC